MKNPSVLSTMQRQPEVYNHFAKLLEKTKDDALRNGMCTALSVCNFLDDKAEKSFVVSDSLATALNSVDCDEVGPWHLKETQAYNFLFNKNLLGDSANKYNEMFLVILPPEELAMPFKNFDKDYHKISIFLVDNTQIDGAMPSTYIGVKFKDGSTIEEILESGNSTIGNQGIEDALKVQAIRLALNLVLYLHSPEPDIMALKPQIYNQKNFRENYFKKVANEEYLRGIYSLGWDFHGREYSVSIGTRKGHFKWQPCGPLWSQRKLIFVQKTTVNYGKNRQEN